MSDLRFDNFMRSMNIDPDHCSELDDNDLLLIQFCRAAWNEQQFVIDLLNTKIKSFHSAFHNLTTFDR